MLVFQYEVAFLSRLNAHSLPLCMRRSRYVFLAQAYYCQRPTAWSVWIRLQKPFRDQGADWLRSYIQKADLLTVRMEVE